MSTVLLTRPTFPPSDPGVRPTVRRPRRQPASGRGPLARPGRALPPPSRTIDRTDSVRSCRVDAAAGAASWRLTERGIAVVLVLATMIVVAAMAVVGLTAWRVTGSDGAGLSGASISSR